MSWLLAAGGVLLLLAVTYDALHTTLAPAGGAGPLTARIGSGVWRLARASSRGPQARPLSVAGPGILLVTVGAWVVLLWAGWSLVFAAIPAGVVHSPRGGTVTVSDLVYFTGFTLFTLGVGDFVPASPVAQFLTPLCTLHGLFLITLSITYLLPVLNAAVDRRQQAAAIWGMGGSATGIVRQAWHAGSLRTVERDLSQLAPQLLTTVERHPAYPVLHFFHSAGERNAYPARVAALDDAVTLLLHVVAEDVRPHPSVLMSIRRAVDDLLNTVGGSHVAGDLDEPPRPDLDALRSAGIPLAEEATVAGVFDDVANRRRVLRQYVSTDGWDWSAVESAPGPWD